MEYNQLGASDLKISEIGFGCMSLKNDSKTNIALLHRALDGGINYFDTADMYDKGLNESLLGEAFKDRRSEVIIATKVGNQWKPDGTGWDWNPSKKYIIEQVEHSLARLQTDYIDLYQLHGGTIEDNIDETIEAFEHLIAQGKIRYYGISSIRPNVVREYVAKSNIVSVMMQYSLLDRRPEEMILPYLQENNIGVLARGSLASGLLVNKDAKQYLNYTANEVKLMADTIKEIYSVDPASIALQYVLQQEAVTSAIVGIRTDAQLEDVLAYKHSSQITVSDWDKIRQTLPANVYEQHR